MGLAADIQRINSNPSTNNFGVSPGLNNSPFLREYTGAPVDIPSTPNLQFSQMPNAPYSANAGDLSSILGMGSNINAPAGAINSGASLDNLDSSALSNLGNTSPGFLDQFKGLFGGSGTTDKTTDPFFTPGVGASIQGVGSLLQALAGFQQLGQAKKVAEQNKQAFNLDRASNATSYNSRVTDQAIGRSKSNPDLRGDPAAQDAFVKNQEKQKFISGAGI